MTITWKLGGRILSDNDHYVLKVGGEEVKVPLMFKIGTKNGEDVYGYLDHEKLGLSHTFIYYVLKKCFYGVSLVGGEGQGVVKTDRGVYKIKLLSLGDARIAADTIGQDNTGKSKLILFDKVYNHKEQEALYDNKKGKTTQAIYEKLEDEAKNDGGAKAVPSSISAEGFVRYAQAYDSDLLKLVLEDQELYQQMFEQDGPTDLVLKSLLTMFLPNGKGYRHIQAVQKEGIIEGKWADFFRLALQKAPPEILESIHPGSMFELLELMVRINYKPALLLLRENAEWNGEFELQLLKCNQNPLRLFSPYFEANEEVKAGEDDTRQAIDSELFKIVVDLEPSWLLDTNDAGSTYFKCLAIYLKTHKDPILHSVFTSNLPLLHIKLQEGTHLEALTLHFLNQKPFDLKHCDYLGLKKGLSSLAKPFQTTTNKLIVSRIRDANSLEGKLDLLEFFSPCLGPNGKAAVLQHLIEPSTINTCDQAVIKLFDQISPRFNLFSARSKEYLDNGGNNWLIYNQFLNHPQSEELKHATSILERLMTLDGGNINSCDKEKVWRLFDKAQGNTFLEIFDIYLSRRGNDWRVYNKLLAKPKEIVSPFAPRLFLRLLALGEEKLFTTLMGIEVDLVQVLEDLKSGDLKLPIPEVTNKFTLSILESLSNMVRIDHPLTTENIKFLMKATSEQIIDFCFEESNEADLQVKTFQAYASMLLNAQLSPQQTRRRASLLKSLKIDKLSIKDFIALIKPATARQIIDICIAQDDEVLRIEILKAYQDRLSKVKLFPIEILTLASNDEAVAILSKQIERVGYEVLFQEVGNFRKPVELVVRLFGASIPLTSAAALSVLAQYPWARECIDAINKVDLSGKITMFKVAKGPDGSDILAIDSVTDFEDAIQDENFNTHQPTDKPYVPRKNSINVGKLIKGINGVSVALNSASRGIKFAEEPSIVGAAELGANLLLLGCIVFPDSSIAKKIQYWDIISKSTADIRPHGILNATVNAVSNLGARYVERLLLPVYAVPLVLTFATTALSFYYSFR